MGAFRHKWSKVVSPTRHKVGHFGDVLPSQSLVSVVKKNPFCQLRLLKKMTMMMMMMMMKTLTQCIMPELVRLVVVLAVCRLFLESARRRPLRLGRLAMTRRRRRRRLRSSRRPTISEITWRRGASTAHSSSPPTSPTFVRQP